MLAHCRQQFVSLCLFVLLLLLALPSSAETFELDFWGYPNFTPISSVSIPGVTFIVPNGATVMTDGETGIDIWGEAGTDLIIRFHRMNDSVRFTAYGYGSCQEDPDTITLYNGSRQVSQSSFFEFPNGRCVSFIYQADELFTEIHFDVNEDDGMEIWNLDVTIVDDVLAFSDGRINSLDMASPVVLYPVDYGNEQWGLHVYAADGSGLLWELSPEDIPADCTNSNRFIAEAAGIQLYRLAADTEGNCAFQLIAPTAEAGKFYYIIFDELSPDTDYQSWEE